MDTEIRFLWELEGEIIFILNLLISVFLSLYCFIKIKHYNDILEYKKSRMYNYICFSVIGAIVALISHMLLQSHTAYLLAYITVILLVKCLYGVSWQQNLFLANDFILTLMLSGGIAPAFISIIRQESMNYTPLSIITLENVFAFSLAIIIIYIFNIKLISTQDWIRFIKSDKQIKSLVIFQWFIEILVILSTFIYEYDLNIVVSYYQFFGMVTISIAYRMLLTYVVKSSVADAYKIRSEIIAEQLEQQISLYNIQANQNIEIRKFKHDFNNLMMILNNLMHDNKYNEMKSIIDQTNELGQNYFNMHKEFSNNVFLQAILSNAYQRSIENNILFSANIVYPINLEIDDIDLCRIFTNIINNSMDACNKIIGESRFISIKSNIEQLWFTVIIQNSFDGQIDSLGGVICSSKENKKNHGLGLKILEETIQLYQGVCSYTWNENVFTVKIHIPINAKK